MKNKSINRKALFCDCTDQYVIRREGELQIRFRTAINDVTSVYILYENVDDSVNCVQESLMHKLYTDEYFDYYESDIISCSGKLLFYFKVQDDTNTEYYSQQGKAEEPDSEDYLCIVNNFYTPSWAKGAVMYQIFTDRFCNGDKSNDVVDDEYVYLKKHVYTANRWTDNPDIVDVRKFYGGDIKGIICKLEYLEKLGIEAIYLNPLFVSPSNHKYDIMDYDHIDPHIGVIVQDDGEILSKDDMNNGDATKFITRVTNEENLKASDELFAYLVKKAHEHNIKVIIDGVFNHCGAFNKWMDTDGIYPEKGAYQAKDSIYRNYFRFTSDRWPGNDSYEKWWENDTLPKLNYEESEELEDYVMSIAAKWVSKPYCADGWRLDVAADIGHSETYNHHFWKRFRDTVKSANPEAVIIAEHYGNPKEWLNGYEWDSIMNYDAFMEPVSYYLTGMEKHSDQKREDLRGNAAYAYVTLRDKMKDIPMEALLMSMNQLSNHDHSRFMTRTNGMIGRIQSVGAKAAEENCNNAVFKEGIIMQMTIPGSPTLYYGDEAGVCGWTDPDNRRTYPWGQEDMELLEFYRDAIAIHKSYKALKCGSIIWMEADENVLVYARVYHTIDEDKVCNERIITIINNGLARKVTIDLTPVGYVKGDIGVRIMQTMKELYNVGRMPISIVDGQLIIDVKEESAEIYSIE